MLINVSNNSTTSTCFDEMSFTAVMQNLENYGLDGNLAKNMPTRLDKILQKVQEKQKAGYGALIDPQVNDKCIEYYAHWVSYCPTEARECVDLPDCDLPEGNKVKTNRIPLNNWKCIETEPFMIDESDYECRPGNLVEDLTKMLMVNMVALVNKVNKDLILWLYENRGINEYEDTNTAQVRGRTTYFPHNTLAEPDNLSYWQNVREFNDFMGGCVLDGSSTLQKAITCARFNGANDNGRGDALKFEEMFGSLFDYTHDLRGLGRCLEGVETSDHPNGLKNAVMLLEPGIVSVMFRHKYPTVSAESLLTSRANLFDGVFGIGDAARFFGQEGMYDTKEGKYNYAVAVPGLTQTFINPDGGGNITTNVFVDIEHDIRCKRSNFMNKRTRCHIFKPTLSYQIMQAPSDCRPDNTGILLFAEDCDLVLDPCVKGSSPCDAVCDTIGIDAVLGGKTLTIEAEPFFEDCDEPSGATVSDSVLHIHKHLNGSKYGQHVATLDNDDLATANTVDLDFDTHYTLSGNVTFVLADGTECEKLIEACIITPKCEDIEVAPSECDRLSYSLDCADNNLSITVVNDGGEDVSADISNYTIIVSSGESQASYSGSELPLVIPPELTGELSVLGIVLVGNCPININGTVNCGDLPMEGMITQGDCTE